MTVSEILSAFERVTGRAAKVTGPNKWRLLCPGHDDHDPSLDLKVAGDRVLLVCRSHGCHRDLDSLLDRVKLRPADLFLRSGDGHDSARQIVAVYDFVDERGSLLFQEVRFAPKDFKLRRPDGKGGFTWTLGDVRRVVYRLNELAEQRRLFLVEGPKDADRLWAIGIPATTTAGGANGWRTEYARQIKDAGAKQVVACRDADEPGLAYVRRAAADLSRLNLSVRMLDLPGLPEQGDVSDYIDAQRAAGRTDDEIHAGLLASVEQAPVFTPAVDTAPLTTTEPELRREGFDLVLTFPAGPRFTLTAIRDGREGVRGELTVTYDGRRLSWGALPLSSTAARETLRKKLDAAAPGPPWGEYLEEAAWRFTQAAREGEPLVTLSGVVTSPTRELLPRLLYESEPTLIYGDGDTGKSLVALSLAVAVHAGVALPFGLQPVRAIPAAYLDWETSRDTIEARLALIAAGLGIDPPGIVYKRMTRPLVDEAAALAADFARRGIGFVVIDSKMFAVAGGEGAAFHEPIVSFYNALRLFAPAASLVLNHITGADARGGGPARPFGGAFAFNGPRLIWEAKRDHDITDETAIAFTCRKANNLPRRPEPFGLRFVPGEGTITVYPLDLTEAAPQTVAGAGLPYRLRLALAQGDDTVESLAERVGAGPAHVRSALHKLKGRGLVTTVPDAKPIRWSLVPR